jgi:gliding motility-associated-like protein
VIGRVRSAKWIPIEGLSDPNIPNPKVWVPRDTAFTVELWANDNSYFGRYKKEVKIVNLSPAAFFEITTDTMGTFPHSILVDNQSASTNASFLWRLGDGNTLSGENIGYTYQKIGKYNLQLIVTQDSSACAFTDSISRNIYVTPKINEITFCPEKPFGTFTILGGTICQVLKENNTDCIKTFTFSGNNLNEPKVFVYSEFNQPYSYVFTVTAKATPYPATTYEYTTLTQADWNSADVTFTGLTKVKTKTWDVGLGNTFRDSVFVVNYPKTGTYDIKVSGIDTNNCQYSIQKEQIIEFMLIPNVFTPNNDGINDSFEIKGLVPNTASLEIFNRWGIKVYESGENAYLNNWKAENQTDGLYYYNFKLNYRPNKPYKGWVQVVR